MLGAFFGDISEVLIEHNAILTRQRDEALAAGAADQRKVWLARKLDAPGSKTGARDQDRDAHTHSFDHHFRRQSPGGVEDLVGRWHAMLEHPAGDLVDRVMPAD